MAREAALPHLCDSHPKLPSSFPVHVTAQGQGPQQPLGKQGAGETQGDA